LTKRVALELLSRRCALLAQIAFEIRRVALEKYDIVIIGGGIAGLSTALHIRRNVNARLLLIDKGVIGDSTKTSPSTFPDVVARFNLFDAVLQKYTRFTYRSPTGVTASFEYENPLFVTLDYQKICNIMLNRIRKAGNTEVLEKTEAVGLEASKSVSTLKLILSNSTNVWCNVLVDASGSNFFALRQLGIGLLSLYSHAYGEFLEGCKIEDPKEMCVFAGMKYGNGGGWLYPIDTNTARFGFATVTRSHFYPRSIVERNFSEAIRNFYPYNEMLADSKRKRSEFGTIPIEPLKKFVYGQIMIVGDAAGQATPWYNEGVRPALESGEICGKTIVGAYEKGRFNKAWLKEYQRLWNAKNGKSYSRATRARFKAQFRTQEQWDDSVRNQASLTPDEMIAKIRYDKWPSFRSNVVSRYWHNLRNLINKLNM